MWIKISGFLVIIEAAIAVKFPNWLIIFKFSIDCFLLEIWKFSIWPISCDITPIKASVLFIYLSKPVVKKIILFSFIKALGLSLSIIENFILLLVGWVINKISEIKFSISWSYIVTALTLEKKKLKK